MKSKILISSFCLCATLVGAGCSSRNQVTSNQHAGMNHSVSNTTANHQGMSHEGMNHGAMNHSDMQSSPNASTAPYDLQFLDTMIAHHQGAVEMAKPAETKAQHAEIKTLAKNIIADQEKEIAQMKKWREDWFAGKPAAINMQMAGMDDSMKGMDMKKFESASGNDFDLEFMKQMTPHHEGAVEMAKEALQKAQKEEIKKLANEIIKAQETEIKQMKGWQSVWVKQ